ncbi:MAG: chorismate mutase [Pseudobdellovibrio sp.]
MQNNDEQIQVLRAEIDEIHTDMVSLFRRRLQLVKKIWAIKKSMDNSMIDPSREEFIIHQFDSGISDKIERTSVQNFLKSVLAESKKYMGHT